MDPYCLPDTAATSKHLPPLLQKPKKLRGIFIVHTWQNQEWSETKRKQKSWVLSYFFTLWSSFFSGKCNPCAVTIFLTTFLPPILISPFTLTHSCHRCCLAPGHQSSWMLYAFGIISWITVAAICNRFYALKTMYNKCQCLPFRPLYSLVHDTYLHHYVTFISVPKMPFLP